MIIPRKQEHLLASKISRAIIQVDGGKQFFPQVGSCPEHYIAAFGSWALFPAQAESQDDNLITFSDNQVKWEPVPNSYATQCEVFEVDSLSCGQNTAALWQGITLSTDRVFTIPSSLIVAGKEYLVACTQFNTQGNRVSFSKLQFNPQDLIDSDNRVDMPPIYYILLDN